MLPVFVCLHVFLGWRQGECRLEYCINAIENKIAIMGVCSRPNPSLSDEECEWMLIAFLEAFRGAPDIIFRSARRFRGRTRTYGTGSAQRVKNCGWTRRVSQLGFACAETTFNWPAIGGCTACANRVLAAVSFESFDFGCFFASDFNL